METNMPDTEENRLNIARFVAQEVKKDEKIPAFDKYAVGEILREGQRRSGKKGEITLRMRELGGLVRIAGDMAVNKGDKLVTAEHVMAARETARSLEQQIADKQIEGMMRYQLFRNEGEAVGLINGLAVLTNGNSSEMSGMVMPLAAEVTPSLSKKGGKIIATGQLGKIAQEAVDNIAAVIKKYTQTDLSQLDIHLEYVAAYNGVDGDSASITMATVIISALENIPIRQDLAMTGSLNVRGTVMPIGGVTAKLEAAANSGIKIALIPMENEKDVMIDRKYYDMMEIYSVETLRDVFEYAFVDCPAKQKYLEALLPLNPSGESTAKRIPIPPNYKKDQVQAEEPAEVAIEEKDRDSELPEPEVEAKIEAPKAEPEEVVVEVAVESED